MGENPKRKHSGGIVLQVVVVVVTVIRLARDLWDLLS